jgi:hypothetical protein
MSAKVVSCSNINGYLRNYQDCLTLVVDCIEIKQYIPYNIRQTYTKINIPSKCLFVVMYFYNRGFVGKNQSNQF